MATEIPFLVSSRDPEPLPSGVSGSDLYIEDNDGNATVHVTNPTGSAVTISLVRQATIAGETLPNRTEDIGAGQDLWFGPLPPALYNDSNQQAHILDPSSALVFNGLRF